MLAVGAVGHAVFEAYRRGGRYVEHEFLGKHQIIAIAYYEGVIVVMEPEFCMVAFEVLQHIDR